MKPTYVVLCSCLIIISDIEWATHDTINQGDLGSKEGDAFYSNHVVHPFHNTLDFPDNCVVCSPLYKLNYMIRKLKFLAIFVL